MRWCKLILIQLYKDKIVKYVVAYVFNIVSETFYNIKCAKHVSKSLSSSYSVELSGWGEMRRDKRLRSVYFYISRYEIIAGATIA